MKLNQNQLRNLQVATERLAMENVNARALWQQVTSPLFYFNPELDQEEVTGVECYRDVSRLGIISAICLLGDRSLVTIDLEGLGMTPPERMLFFGFCNFILDLGETLSFRQLGLDAPENLRDMGMEPEPICPTRRHFVCNCRVPHLFLAMDEAFQGKQMAVDPGNPSESDLNHRCRVASAQIYFEIEGPNHVLVAAELVRYARALMTLASSAVCRAVGAWGVPGTAGFDVDDEDLERLWGFAEDHPFQYGKVQFHCEG